MFKFKSLTAKFIFISLISVAVLAVYFYTDFGFTHHMKGEAARINIAGRQRMLTLSMSYQIMAMLYLPSPSPERDIFIKNTESRIAEYEEALYSLKDGNEKIGRKPVPEHDQESISQVNTLIELWSKTQKPALRNIMKIPPERKNEACGMCHSAIRDNIPKIDALVKLLESHHEKGIKDFDTFRFYMLGFFFIGAVFTVFYIRRSIIKPVGRLKDAVKEIEKGDFDVKVDVKTRDDIGVLGSAFNSMSQTLNQLFMEKAEHLREMSVLNQISVAANKSLTVEIMLNEVMDTILNLEPLRLEKKGAIFLCDEDKKTLKLIVSRNFSDEHTKLCSTVPFGECLCGLCAEKGEILISKSNVEDKRHTRTYSEHGHIILPLKSRDKMLGVLCLYLSAGIKLSDRETEEMYRSIADIISVSLQNILSYEKTQQSEASLHEAQRIAHLGNWDWDIVKNELRWSDEIYRMFGLSPQEFGETYEAFLNYVHPDDRDFVQKSINEALYEGKPYSIDHRIVLPDGAEKIVHEQAEVTFNESGKLIKMIGTVQDITEQKRAEEALWESESKFKNLTEKSLVGIYLIQDGVFKYANPRLSEILGYAVEDLIDKKGPKDLTLPEDWPIVEENLRKRISGEVESIHYNFRGITKNKETIYAEVYGTRTVYKERPAVIGTLLDITERKLAEDRLKKSYQTQNILNSLLNVSLEEISLKELLVKALDTILSVPFLPLMPKGGIFVVEDEPDVLILTANRGFSVPIQEICARVPFGRCLCGRAAANREIQFADCLDERHENSYDGITPHGHYNVPILSKGKVLGVLVLYLQEGHRQEKEEIDFLHAVADAMAGVIERKQAEEDLKQHSKELLALADASNVVLTTTTTTTTTTYDVICDIAVRNFGLKMAWLGLIEEGSFDVKPAAQSGFEEGYLSSVKITYDDSPAGMGPTGMAIKTKMARVVHDMETDPAYIPWREQAMKRGYRSSMAVPMISSEGKVISTINLYSGEPGFFTSERIELFQVFANQAATAIENKWLLEGLEEKVMKRTSELEEAVAELEVVNRELQLRRVEAEAANRAKSDFLANMSHELRTPLNAIIGFSDMLRDGMAGEINEEQKDYLKDIYESGNHLLTLINDILDISKVETGKMELELSEFNLEELIDGSLVMFKEKAMKHNIKVKAEVEEGIGNIIADERKIKQVLFNLLSNAMKFTPDGGSVRVTARRTRDEASGRPSSFEIAIEDTGIGISSEDQKRLFQPFQQLESTFTKKYGGTGLGLSISKKIVELHGGRIWAESKPGKGSRFIFVIPVRQ